MISITDYCGEKLLSKLPRHPGAQYTIERVTEPGKGQWRGTRRATFQMWTRGRTPLAVFLYDCGITECFTIGEMFCDFRVKEVAG